jgi:hypothetical protein
MLMEQQHGVDKALNFFLPENRRHPNFPLQIVGNPIQLILIPDANNHLLVNCSMENKQKIPPFKSCPKLSLLTVTQSPSSDTMYKFNDKINMH